MFSRRGFLQVSGGAAGYLTLGKYFSAPLEQIPVAIAAADAAAVPDAAPFYLFSRCSDLAAASRFSPALTVQDLREYLLQGEVDLHKVKAAQPEGQKLYWESMALPEGLDWESLLNRKAENMAHLHGMMQGLTALPPEEVIKGYESYLGTAAEFYDDPVYVMEYVFGELPEKMDAAYLQDFFRSLQEEKEAFFALCRKKLPPAQAAEMEHRFEETAAQTARESDENYGKATRASISRFVDTIAKAMEDKILKLEVKPSESGETHFSLVFNTSEFPEEACHYMLGVGGGMRMSVSESVKASLNGFQLMTLTDKDKTKWSKEAHYDKAHQNNHGGWITDSIDVESSEPLMQRIVGELMRRSASAHLSYLFERCKLHHCISCNGFVELNQHEAPSEERNYRLQFSPPPGTPQQITDARREFEAMTEEFFRLPRELGIRCERDSAVSGAFRVTFDREKYWQLAQKLQGQQNVQSIVG